MATPTPPSGNNVPKQPSGNGTGPIKPRATIVMKNPNSNPGSQPRIPAAGGPPPASSARVPVSRPSSAASVRKQQTDREALGLSAARPSEMIAGLDEAAKRAEALAVREEAKRKSGGKMSANAALHVDDTGRKWSRWVQLGIAVLVLAGGAVGGWMFYSANRQKIGERAGLEITRADLNDMARSVESMEQFKEGESITVQGAKERLHKRLEADLETEKSKIARDKAAGRNPDRRSVEQRERLERQLTFKDAWGKPLDFSVEGDDLIVRSTSTVKGESIDSIKTRIRETPVAKPPEKDEKVK